MTPIIRRASIPLSAVSNTKARPACWRPMDEWPYTLVMLNAYEYLYKFVTTGHFNPRRRELNFSEPPRFGYTLRSSVQ